MAAIDLGANRMRRRLPRGIVVRGDGGDPNSRESLLAAIVSCIPGDVLGLYLAYSAAFALEKATVQVKWVTFWVFLGLTPVLYLLGVAATYREAQKQAAKTKSDSPKFPPYKEIIRDIVLALFAFPAWACTLPQGPFIQAFPQIAGPAGAFVLVAAAFFLGLAKKILP